MKNSTLGALVLVILAGTACESDPISPSDEAPTPAGIDFGLAEGTFGALHADQKQPAAGAPLTDEFAVAVPDSVGGLVLLGYDITTSNLFILQVASTREGTYECGPVTNATPCHARYFENVQEESGVVQVDGRLDLATGHLVLDEVGPDQVAGTFEAHFQRTAGEGDSTADVENGTILVDLLEGPVENGGLACLVRLTTGATDCS